MVLEPFAFGGSMALPTNLPRLARVAAFFLATSLALASVAGPSEDANAAYTKGDYATALRLWRDLAEQGDASAQTSLGRMYRDGRGVSADQAEAVKWFRKAAEQGDAAAQANLGFMYGRGRGVPKDDGQAVDWFRKAAEQGYALGQVNLGAMYQSGHGVPQDDQQAVEWFRKAAEQGNALGQANLGFMYERGRGGLPQDDKQALEWFRKAAEQGNALGQANLGAMYQGGRAELPQDDQQAVDWYRKAAEQGNALGQANLGFMYRSGRGGLPQDDKQALEWFRKAAEQGNALGQANLGVMYQGGRAGLPQDDQQAVEWYRKAAEQGFAMAQTNLGTMYQDGRGVPQDHAEAEQWLRKAAEQGDARAKTLVSSIERAQAEIEKAAKLTRERESNSAATAVEPAVRKNVVPITKVQPEYPREAFRAGINSGRVIARLHIDETGNVTEVTIKESNPKMVFDDEVIRALSQWKFRPEGQRFVGEVEVKFALTDGSPVSKPADLLADAKAAFDRGDYATAEKLWRPAAEGGNASAQASLGEMYETGRGVAKDEAEAVKWYRKAAEQGFATAQTDLGVMYRDGRGVAKDDAEAERWFRKAADQGETKAQTVLSSIENGRRELDLSRTIAELVKSNAKDLSVAPPADAERARLAREVIDASGARETLIDLPERLDEGFSGQRRPPNISPKLLEAIRVTAIASFRPDKILASMERKLAETLDAATLQVGLQWEHSDVGRHMHRLYIESVTPEKRTAIQEFARELVSKGGRTNDPRARACAQADTLANETETYVPFSEALIAGMMIGGAQQLPTLDLDGVRRAVVAARPLLREGVREGLLAQCLFTYRDLSDAEVEQWLAFLRSDSGGRHARGLNDAFSGALLDATEVFTRTLLEVARQIKGRGDS